jgi:UDP-N-acetyl-D-galactosamine dehydrogenase
LEAAGTKWNFLKFQPGLVGGHCIGVDPYYLTQRAERAGYYPQVILSGRRINDGLGAFIAQNCLRLLSEQSVPLKGARILILGITFKEDCSDCRNTRVVDMIRELQSWGCVPIVCDPHADAEVVRHEYGIELVELNSVAQVDAVILAVAHACWRDNKVLPLLSSQLPRHHPLLDIKAICDRTLVAKQGWTLWRL